MLISIKLTEIDENQHLYFLISYGNKHKIERKVCLFLRNTHTSQEPGPL